MSTARPVKRVKLDTDAKKKAFSSVGQIQASLRNADNESNTVNVITALRSQFHVNADEVVSPKDSRLLLLCEWVSVDPGLQRLFDIWSSVTQRHSGLHALLPSLLCSVLTLLNAHYTYHQHGHQLLKSLLLPTWMRKINSALTGNLSSDATLHSLRLLNAMSTFSGGKEKPTLLEAFHWDLKVFHKLLSLRRKPSGSQNPIYRPDIRTLTLMYILSFVTSGTSPALKTTFLTTHRNIFTAIWKGLGDDPFSVVKLVLESCWEHILSDARVSRNTKISIFAEVTISHILKLYARNEPEDVDEQGDHVPADLAHHFLLAIMTRPGQGICFQDKGWYPRAEDTAGPENEPSEEGDAAKKGIYNKILGNVLKNLKVGEDTRQQELALKVLESCPELVSGYWSSAGLTLNPRLSSRWIANISFVGNVVSLPIPTRSFLLSPSTPDPSSSALQRLYNPTPPPLTTIVANILPTTLTKPFLTKGLASPTPSTSSVASRLVQHCTAMVLIKCLNKLRATLEEFARISIALEEREYSLGIVGSTTENLGQWTLRAYEVRQELRKRLPEFNVIVAFAREFSSDGTGSRSVVAQEGKETEATPDSLLGEMSQRISWLYSACLPDSLRESNLDPGKLLLGADTLANRNGLSVLKTLHTLRILHQSREGWLWSGKPSGSNKSSLHTLLKILSASASLSLCHASESLLTQLFADSPLFSSFSPSGGDSGEVVIWLEAFQTTHNDSADTIEHLVTFFEDCIQRCLKTPYRYLEEMQRMLARSDRPDPASSPSVVSFSPLMATILEQLPHKLRAGSAYTLESPSVDAVCRVLGNLLIGLIGFADVTGLSVLKEVVDTLRSSLQTCQRTGMEVADQQLQRVKDTLLILNASSHSPTKSLVTQSEQFLIDEPTSFAFVYQYTDWLRRRLASSVDDSNSSPTSEDIARNMIEMAFTSPCSPPPTYILRAIRIVAHSLPPNPDKSSTADGLEVLKHILLHSANRLPANDVAAIKSTIFRREQHLKTLFVSEHLSTQVCEAIRQIMSSILDTTSSSDQDAVSEITEIWAKRIALHLRRFSEDATTSLSSASLIWIPWFKTPALLALLDDICALATRPRQAGLESSIALAHSVLNSLDCSSNRGLLTDLMARKSALYSLRSFVDSLRVFKACVRSLDNVLLNLMANVIPPLVDGRHAGFPSTNGFSDLINQVAHRVDLSLSVGQEGSSTMISVLLPEDDEWSETRICAASASILAGRLGIADLEAWRPGHWHKQMRPTVIARISRAIAEQTYVSGKTLPSENEALLLDVPTLLLGISMSAETSQHQWDAAAAIVAIARVTPSSQIDRFCDLIIKNLQQATSTTSISSGAAMCQQLQDILPDAPLVGSMLREALSAGMRWLVRFISGQTWDTNGRAAVKILSSLGSCTVPEAHLLDPLLTAVIQHALQEPAIISLCADLLSASNLKPVAVNRHIQSLLQHPQFSLVCQSLSPKRIAVISLLHGLFVQHPWNTSQPSHLQPLVAVYHGSLSACDQKLLAIFKLFEIHRKSSVGSLLSQWPATTVGAGATALQALCSLDAVLVLRTSLDFPIRRKTEDVSSNTGKAVEGHGIDPLFCLLLFCQMLTDGPPQTALTWVELFRTNVVGLVIRCLSSRDQYLRELALSALAGLYTTLLEADMQERPHVIHLLDLIRDQIPSKTSTPPRLPSYTTLLCFHALRAVFLPSNFIYPATAIFLLQRPELDMLDVPMLFSMLYSSADNWKQERLWMVRFVTTGMAGAQEWNTLKKRHVWDLLASLFQASSDDSTIRKCILECFANITCCPHASADLLKKSSVLAWIEMQVVNDLLSSEAVAWLRLLDNLTTTTNPKVLLAVMQNGGSQRVSSILRSLLAGAPTCVFPLLPSLLLRLLRLIPSCKSQFEDLITFLVACFPEYEATVQGSGKEAPDIVAERPPCRPYTALTIHQPVPQPVSVRTWGVCVEHSWRCVLEQGDAQLMRTMLPRLAVWWSLPQHHQDQVGEWARLETLRNLQYSVKSP